MSEGPEGLSEGHEGLSERPWGLPGESQGLSEGLGDGRMDIWTEGLLLKNHFYELCSRITSKQIRTDARGWSHIATNSIFFSKKTYI